jgi:hypothetical protein
MRWKIAPTSREFGECWLNWPDGEKETFSMSIQSLFIAGIFAFANCAHAQTTNGEWAYTGQSHWGLAVFSGPTNGYRATGPVRFYLTKQACQRDGEAAVNKIVYSNPSCKSMSCRPYAFWTCSELDEGASGRISQVQ